MKVMVKEERGDLGGDVTMEERGGNDVLEGDGEVGELQ